MGGCRGSGLGYEYVPERWAYPFLRGLCKAGFDQRTHFCAPLRKDAEMGTPWNALLGDVMQVITSSQSPDVPSVPLFL